MTIRQPKQRPLRLHDVGKHDVRTQFGALCWRARGERVEFLLITSRRSKRWIIPKGWPADGATPAEAAQTEAWEEAGVDGKIKPICLGIYSYTKDLSDDETYPCVVAVFPIRVRRLSSSFPEKFERQRKWFGRKRAAKLVAEPELATMILHFDPANY